MKLSRSTALRGPCEGREPRLVRDDEPFTIYLDDPGLLPSAHNAADRKERRAGEIRQIAPRERQTDVDAARHCRPVLQNAGWEFGSHAGQISVAEAGQEPTPDALNIFLCKDTHTSRMQGAIPAEPFQILDALGAARLEQALTKSVPPGLPVDRVIVGFNWTLVRAGDLCGIARSRACGIEGARTIRPAEGFAGQDVRDLASNLNSMDALRRSLGLAAVNAYCNRMDSPDADAAYLAPRGGLATIRAPGENAVIVGGFRAALERLPRARIVEREPKPGDIPLAEARTAYQSTSLLAVTAQTLMNGSLAPILALSGLVPYRILVGPSCPASPLLFDHGLDEIFGAVILDPEAAETFIRESGTMIMLDHIATTRTLCATLERDKTPP